MIIWMFKIHDVPSYPIDSVESVIRDVAMEENMFNKKVGKVKLGNLLFGDKNHPSRIIFNTNTNELGIDLDNINNTHIKKELFKFFIELVSIFRYKRRFMLFAIKDYKQVLKDIDNNHRIKHKTRS